MVRLLLASLLLVPSLALAKMNGIATLNCFGCHGNASTPPAVSLTGPSQSIAPGGTVTLTLTLTGPISNGGFFLTSKLAGTFTAGTGTRLFTDGIGHSVPRAQSSGSVSWQISWTAPSTPGGTEFDVGCVGGNGDSHSSGDRPGQARLSLAWGCTPAPYYLDFDGDGHGDPLGGQYLRCGPSAGLAAAADDCNDNDSRVSPAAPEACNGRDDNCNGNIDEGLTATTTWPDLDGDGYGDSRGPTQAGCATQQRAANDQDCSDSDAKIFPGAAEVCNQKDDDCDSQVDEGVRVICGRGWCGRFGPSCDPALCIPGPPMAEACNNFDDDCDGVKDNGALCASDELCFEGRCYAVDVPPDAGIPDAGVPVHDAGVPLDDAGSTPEPEPQPQRPPGGCQSVPGLGLALALALVSRGARGPSTACRAHRGRAR